MPRWVPHLSEFAAAAAEGAEHCFQVLDRLGVVVLLQTVPSDICVQRLKIKAVLSPKDSSDENVVVHGTPPRFPGGSQSVNYLTSSCKDPRASTPWA